MVVVYAGGADSVGTVHAENFVAEVGAIHEEDGLVGDNYPWLACGVEGGRMRFLVGVAYYATSCNGTSCPVQKI